MKKLCVIQKNVRTLCLLLLLVLFAMFRYCCFQIWIRFCILV